MQEFVNLLNDYGLSESQVLEFVSTKQFEEIPCIDIFSNLWAHSFTLQRNDEQLSHDFNDIELLSAYLLYCSIVCTDKHMKELVRQLKLDTKYNCTIYTVKKEDLDNMKAHLEELSKTTKPANTSTFSVVCTKPENYTHYTRDFVCNIAGIRNSFVNRNKNSRETPPLIEIFLVYNEGEIPKEYNGKITEAHLEAMASMGFNIREITFSDSIEKTIDSIPSDLRGSATAVLPYEVVPAKSAEEYMVFSRSVLEDIENAIENNLEISPKYDLDIIYN